MINLIRSLFVRPVVRMTAKLADAQFDSINSTFNELRFYFKDNDKIQLSKDFADVRGIGIVTTSDMTLSYSFKPIGIKLYVGDQVRPSTSLVLTKNEQAYLKTVLLKLHRTVEQRKKNRERRSQNELAYKMAKSLKKHIN